MATTVTQLSALVKVEPAAISSPELSSNTLPLHNMERFDRPASFKEEAVPLEKLSFQPIDRCAYTPKYLGSSDQEALGCECGEEWDGDRNEACGDDSDCINRICKVECVDQESSCGSGCQNQRFQLRQYADVEVFKTEKKGHGLRTRLGLSPNAFIYEYIGEVINESAFRRRTIQYDEEGIKHFYFMSLQNGVFIDATRKGNLGRFCNHSCKPNCYVDKWIVGDKVRMGIFAKRAIRAGEELVFDYNVDRYGADPQPCYCGEPNCTGFIGGKTQTERATKLATQTLEALGIDDGEDDWDIAVPKRTRKKRAGEDDEDYVDRQAHRSLDERGVRSVMPTLMQSREKWIVVRLLARIQACDDERIRNSVVRLRGYQTMSSTLQIWREDVNVVLQVLDILDQFPRLTRNKITDSKIESTIEGLLGSEDERVQHRCRALLDDWGTLELAYRIPRKKRDPNDAAASDRPDRRELRHNSRDRRKSRSRSRSGSRSRSTETSRVPSAAPTGPRLAVVGRAPGLHDMPRAPFQPRRPFNPLPQGWFAAQQDGRAYYYSVAGQTSWTRPTMPAQQPPPPPKMVSNEQKLQEIIDSITTEKPREKPTPPQAPEAPPEPPPEPVKEVKAKPEKWRSYGEEKRKKLYENTLFPHIQYVVNKYKTKLPREDLKRFAKEAAKKLVTSDFKNNRVEDPTKISTKQEKQVKKWVKDYFDKAVVKKRQHDAKKAQRRAGAGDATASPSPLTPVISGGPIKDSPASNDDDEDDHDIPMTGDGEKDDGDGDDDHEVDGHGDVKMQDPDTSLGIAMDIQLGSTAPSAVDPQSSGPRS